SPWFVSTGQFTNEGYLDLAVALANANRVAIRLGNGDGTFRTAPDINLTGRAATIAVADFNRDGFADLAIGVPNVSVARGRGDGTFFPAVYLGTNGDFVTVGNFNIDDNPDLVVLASEVSVFVGAGDGTFRPRQTFAAGNGPSSAAVEDFNGDGLPDLVVTN